jgi:hypothetical protein
MLRSVIQIRLGAGVRPHRALRAASQAAVALCLLPLSAANAAIWPEQWWEYKRLSVEQVHIDDPLVWEEYGLQEAETAAYDDGQVKFRATAWRLRDSTSALGVFQWKRPAGWRDSTVEETAASVGSKLLFVYGNYVILLDGHTPDEEKRKILYIQLPRLEMSSLPVLASYLPKQGLVDGSSRYVIGPVSLEKFEPRIPPSLAAFHLGAEAQLGRFSSPKGETTLVIFSYPTPNMARNRLDEFSKLPGLLAKRTGPMLAVLVHPPDPDEAERLLARINYRAVVSWNESTSAGPEHNPGDLILGIFKLTGLLILFTILAGAAYGGIRRFGSRYLGWQGSEGSMVTLHLEQPAALSKPGDSAE